jgi:hypothetical protein
MNQRLKLPTADDFPKAAPVEFAGQWVAWNREQTEIVGHGRTWMEARQAAADAGVTDPVLQKVPRPDAIFIGVRR